MTETRFPNFSPQVRLNISALFDTCTGVSAGFCEGCVCVCTSKAAEIKKIIK